MNAERKSRLRVLWLAGTKSEAICSELGIELSTLKKNRQRLGLTPRIPGAAYAPKILPTLSDRKTLEAYQLWRRGHDTLKIAAIMGAVEPAVYNSLCNYRELLRRRETA